MLQELLTQRAVIGMLIMLAVYMAVVLGVRCNRGEKINKIMNSVAMEGALFVVVYHVVAILLMNAGY